MSMQRASMTCAGMNHHACLPIGVGTEGPGIAWWEGAGEAELFRIVGQVDRQLGVSTPRGRVGRKVAGGATPEDEPVGR
jgi:hypothetical protein